MADKKKFPKCITPKGQSKSAFLAKPNTKFSPEGDYQITLVMPANSAEAKQLMAALDEVCEEAVEEISAELEPAARKKLVKVDPYKPEVDQEGEETGNLEFRFKQKAMVKTKAGKIIEFKPSVFDARKRFVPTEGLVLGNGSTIRVSYTPRGYYVASSGNAGLSLTLNAVQIIKLVKFEGNEDSSGHHDNEGDGGFVAGLLKTAKSHDGSEEDSQ